MKLNNYVQDLIDKKEITMGAQTSPNTRLQIFQNAFPSHNQNIGKDPLLNNIINNTTQKNNAQNKQDDKRNAS